MWAFPLGHLAIYRHLWKPAPRRKGLVNGALDRSKLGLVSTVVNRRLILPAVRWSFIKFISKW